MRRVLVVAIILAGVMIGGEAWAQDDVDDRPAVPSASGDTGLWFVPTGEVLKSRDWSFSLYRTEIDFNQGFTDVSFFPFTLAVGLGDRAELFGSLRIATRVDRDSRPIFAPATAPGSGILNDYPFVREQFSDNGWGDLYAGVKFNLISEQRAEPFAMALRGIIKFPTANSGTAGGVGTGELDYIGDLIMSRELGRSVELSGFGGFAYRTDPDFFSLANTLRWGAGAAFGSRSRFRLTTEVYGEAPLHETVLITPGVLVGEDGSIAPTVSELGARASFAAGLTYQHPSGMLLGVGVNYRFGLKERSEVAGSAGDISGDGVGLQFRLGFHNGVRVYVPPPPPVAATPPPAPAPVVVVAAPPPAPAPAPPPNRLPTVQAQCDPCRVEVGQAVSIVAVAQDPDGDILTARWAASSGTLVTPGATTTQWRAETVPGPAVMTVTIADGRGGSAVATVTVEVVRPPVPRVVLADVQFDLDKSTLRIDGVRELDRAVAAMNMQPTLRVHLEGYASPEGSAAYNMALSQRRAVTVRNYMLSKGIAPARVTFEAVGEDRPKYDNASEINRALNRRVQLIVEGQN